VALPLTAWAIGAAITATAADNAAGGGDLGALYASVSAIVVAMIGGTVAIITNRRNPTQPDPQPVRYLDPPSSNALPTAMAELYEHVRDELDQRTIERDVWRQRAIRLGWDEADQ
jgi:hypothetical protein